MTPTQPTAEQLDAWERLAVTDELLHELERAYKASTPGNWRRGHKELSDIKETAEWLGRMVDYYPERPNLEMLCAMVDGSDPPEVLDNVEEFVCPAVTGNGPRSEANAYFMEVAHNYFPVLLAEVRRLRAALADNPTQADMDAAQFEINRLRAQREIAART